MRISDIMSDEVISVDADLPADHAWEVMKLHQIHHLVVTARGKMPRVISDKELGGPHGAAVRMNRSVGELVTQVPVHVSPATTVREAANLLRSRASSCLLVMDDFRVEGIVTVSDLLEAIGSGGALRHPITSVKQVRQMAAWPRRTH